MASSSPRVTEKSSLQHDGSLGTSWGADRLRQLFNGEEALAGNFKADFQAVPLRRPLRSTKELFSDVRISISGTFVEQIC
eukprot:8930087-Karenia_brevis.AAC.1